MPKALDIYPKMTVMEVAESGRAYSTIDALAPEIGLTKIGLRAYMGIYRRKLPLPVTLMDTGQKQGVFIVFLDQWEEWKIAYYAKKEAVRSGAKPNSQRDPSAPRAVWQPAKRRVTVTPVEAPPIQPRHIEEVTAEEVLRMLK